MKFVWRFNFKNFATIGTFEDTFGDSHNTPSNNNMLNLGKNLAKNNTARRQLLRQKQENSNEYHIKVEKGGPKNLLFP